MPLGFILFLSNGWTLLPVECKMQIIILGQTHEDKLPIYNQSLS